MNAETTTIPADNDDVISGLPVGFERTSSLAVSLARAEVDQQIATARAMPRSIHRAVQNIMTLATLDEQSAEECIYALPRGGKPIRGPSVRLAEIISSQWGNCRVGARVVHVDRIEKYIEAEGVFHDLETNTATTARVRRRISDRNGRLLNEDMIVVTGNAACAIAKRNAILGAVPKAVWRKTYDAVEAVIGGDVKTLAERRDRAIAAFGTYGVTADQIFAALGVTGLEDIVMDHLVTLTAARSALKNNEATIEELFPKTNSKSEGRPAMSMAERLDALAGGDKKREAEDVTQVKASDQLEPQASVSGDEVPENEPETTAQVAEDAAPQQPEEPASTPPDAGSEASPAGDVNFPGDAPPLLEKAQAISTLGRRNFDAWHKQLSDEDREALKPEMTKLMSAANAVTAAEKKSQR